MHFGGIMEVQITRVLMGCLGRIWLCTKYMGAWALRIYQLLVSPCLVNRAGSRKRNSPLLSLVYLRILLSTLQKLLAPCSHGKNTHTLVNQRKCKKLRQLTHDAPLNQRMCKTLRALTGTAFQHMCQLSGAQCVLAAQSCANLYFP